MIQKIINFFSENVFSKEFGIVGAIASSILGIYHLFIGDYLFMSLTVIVFFLYLDMINCYSKKENMTKATSFCGFCNDDVEYNKEGNCCICSRHICSAKR